MLFSSPGLNSPTETPGLQRLRKPSACLLAIVLFVSQTAESQGTSLPNAEILPVAPVATVGTTNAGVVLVDAWSGRVISQGPLLGTFGLAGMADFRKVDTPVVDGGGTTSTSDAASISTSMCFDNIVLSGLTGVVPAGAEIIDWGVKSCVGTGFVTRLAIGYSTTALDPSSGGPGASFTFALYQGTTGFGQVGTEVASFDLSGLPGTTVAGQAITFALFLDMGNKPLYLPDGNLGWGFRGQDMTTGPLLTIAPNSALGVQDLMDLYLPAPAHQSTYITTSTPYPGQNSGSIALQVEQLDPSPLANTVVDIGSGINPVLLTELQPAVFGDTWVGQVDLSGHPASTLSALAVAEGSHTPIVTAFGETLINIFDPGLFFDLSFGLHAQPIVPLVDLLGRTFHVQGGLALLPSGLIFTNALVVTVGF